MTVSLTHFAARVGDHNDRAMAASPVLAEVLGARLGTAATVIGEPSSAEPTGWQAELATALPALLLMATRYDEVFTNGHSPVAAISRCATALATLPVVARHRPDAVVVWYDAHADLNTPVGTESGYLGGLALSGPLGLWDSGLGAGLAPRNTVIVGARDIDEPERAVLASGDIRVVPVGADMSARLALAIDGRPVYVHIDCDVLDPGIVPTDYHVPGGMTLEQLTACARALAQSEVIGLEIGELETGETPPRQAEALIVDALEPLLARLDGGGRR
ncbi:arginase family protein [Leucobacter sp. NPDC058333]|uniref:arginase family protein n=1 Tax=Leucobacter sp. NPDC058333 TaxID=3346450 RepID=UPI00364F3896